MLCVCVYRHFIWLKGGCLGSKLWSSQQALGTGPGGWFLEHQAELWWLGKGG